MNVSDLKPHDRVLLTDLEGDLREIEVHSVVTDVPDHLIVVWWNISNNHRTFVGTSIFEAGAVIDAETA